MRIRLIPIYERKKKSLFQVIMVLLLLIGILIYMDSQKIKVIKFSYEIETNKTGHQLWDFLSKSFPDSDKIEMWPNQVIQTQTNPIFSQGNSLEIKYKFLSFQKTFNYVIAHLATSREITYETGKNHPLKGAETMTILPKGNKSVLKWSGRYEYKGLSLTGFWYEYYFKEKFVEELKEKLND